MDLKEPRIRGLLGGPLDSRGRWFPECPLALFLYVSFCASLILFLSRSLFQLLVVRHWFIIYTNVIHIVIQSSVYLSSSRHILRKYCRLRSIQVHVGLGQCSKWLTCLNVWQKDKRWKKEKCTHSAIYQPLRSPSLCFSGVLKISQRERWWRKVSPRSLWHVWFLSVSVLYRLILSVSKLHSQEAAHSLLGGLPMFGCSHLSYVDLQIHLSVTYAS